jgi:hypothetical protein
MITVVPDITVGGSSIAGQSTVEYPFPVQPAPIGTAVHITPLAPYDASWLNFSVYAYVSAPNIVKVRVTNITAGALTPVAQGFKLKLFTDPSLG